MDKALKIGKLIAIAAETIMATFFVADSIDNLATRKKAKKTDNNGKPADEKAAAQA